MKWHKVKHVWKIYFRYNNLYAKNIHILYVQSKRAIALPFSLERSNFIFPLMSSHFQSLFFSRPASQSFLPIAMHYSTSGAACTLYIKGICLLSQGMEYQLCFEFGRLINCLTLHTYTRLSCDIDPRQIQIDRVGGARRFAFRPLRVAWINTNFQ